MGFLPGLLTAGGGEGRGGGGGGKGTSILPAAVKLVPPKIPGFSSVHLSVLFAYLPRNFLLAV